MLPLLALVIAFTACERDARYRHDESAREAGRQAYRTSQQIKRGAREAEQDLRDASREFKEGWEQARHDEESRPRKRTDADRERDQK
jgi:hypothetical protein